MSALPFIPKYNIEDYLHWEGDWELWDGVPVSRSPSPNFHHQRTGTKMVGLIENQLSKPPCEDHCQAVYEMDWQIDVNTVVRPDIMVVCHDIEGDWVVDPPTLIVEILSPSTRDKDLTAKKELYASNGVRYYLIVDPTDEVAIFLELIDSAYQEIDQSTRLDLSGDCSLELLVSKFFPKKS